MLSRTAVRTAYTRSRRFASSTTAGAKKAAEKATNDASAEAAQGLKLYGASALAWYVGWVSNDAYVEHRHFIEKKGRRLNGEFYQDRDGERYYYASHGLRCTATTSLEAALYGAKRKQEVHAFQGLFWPVVVASRLVTTAVGFATDAFAPSEMAE